MEAYVTMHNVLDEKKDGYMFFFFEIGYMLIALAFA